MWISIYTFQRIARDPETDEILDDMATIVERAKKHVKGELVANEAIDYIKENQPPKSVVHYRGERDAELLEDVDDEYAYNFNASPTSAFKPEDEGYIIELRAHVKPGNNYFPTHAEAEV